jgi:hypothetical protein
MLFLFILAFIPVIFASGPPNDPFFDIFNVEKPFALEPTSITKAREDISKAKAFFEKEFSKGEISPEINLQKNLLLEYHRIYFNIYFPVFYIDSLISAIAFNPLEKFFSKCHSDWLYQIQVVLPSIRIIRTSISLLLTPPEYESLLGFLGDAKEEQKLAIFDKIQEALEDGKWNDNCCSSFAACGEIIKLKTKLIDRASEIGDGIQILAKEQCSIFSSLKSMIDVDEPEFDKMSKALFSFLFFNILEKLPQEAQYELIFYRLMERGIKFSPSDANINFLAEIKRIVAHDKLFYPKFKKVKFSDLVESPELIKAGTPLVEKAIIDYKLCISKPPELSSNPVSDPLQKESAPNSVPMQNANAQTSVPMQNANAQTSVPMQNANAQTSVPMQNANAQTSVPMQNVNAQTSVPMQNASAQTSVPMQNANAQNSDPLKNVKPSDSKSLQQNSNLPSTSPDQRKIIAAICVIILFILSAIGIGFYLYRRSSNSKV